MKNTYHIATIGCRLKGLTSRDYISVGLILIENEKAYRILISDSKMDLLKHMLTNDVHNFFTGIIEGYKRSFMNMTYESIERDSRYQNGILSIENPRPFALNSVDGDKDEFINRMFEKYIEFKKV